MVSILYEAMEKDKQIASLKQEFQVNQCKTFINNKCLLFTNNTIFHVKLI